MKSQLPAEIVERIKRCGVIAVLVVDEVRDAVPLAQALLDGGVDVMELTLRTPAAVEALTVIRADVPEMVAGIGTILTPAQVKQVADAGAAFGVAPGLSRRVVQAARELHLPFAPGVATPSDVEKGLELGCRDLKFFPAEPTGGLKYLKSIAAPYTHLGLRFVPLGGINLDNSTGYLADPLVLAVGGSWLAPRSLIQNGEWLAIRTRAAEARAAVDRLRGEGET